ncbi:MAG: AsmA family protein [Desulfobacterium sp.]|jgi:AsmA protein|nr:AsmA family protein [Desulfobacterium sp.]
MGKILKWLLILFGTFAGLIILAILLIPLFVDVNSYKQQIEQQVTRTTGRSFVLGGEIDLSIFPWVGISLSDLTLGSPEGFDQRTFITVKEFEVRVKVLPLLSKNVQVKKFVVDSPEIFLVKDKTGATNWDMGGTQASTPPKKPEDKSASAGEQAIGDLPIKALFVDEFAIHKGLVHYSDLGLKVKKEISDISLTLGNLTLEEQIKVAFSAVAEGHPIALDGTVGPIGRKPGTGTIPLDLTLKALNEITMTLAGEVVDPITTPGFNLDIALASFSPKKLLEALGVSQPMTTADPKAMESLKLNLTLKGDPENITVSNGILVLDDSTLTFTARAGDFSKPDIGFDMALDSIDIDRYLPPKQEPVKPSEKAQLPSQPTQPAGKAPSKIDYTPLRTLAIDGTLRIGTLVAERAKLQEIEVKVTGKNGRFSLDPLSLDLYGGTLVSRADLNVTTDTPAISFAVDAEKIASGLLLADLLEKKIIQGQLDSTVRLAFAGDTPTAIKKSLNGGGNLTFTDGAIIGIDIPGMVRNVKASFGVGERTATPPSTDFAELKVPFTITNGLVSTPNTTLNSPLLRIMAKGTADLVAENIDMRVEPKFVSTLKGQGDTEERSGLMIPILVTGTFDQPKFRPDLTSMVKEIVPDREALESMVKDGKIDKDAVKKKGEEIKQLFKGFAPLSKPGTE